MITHWNSLSFLFPPAFVSQTCYQPPIDPRGSWGFSCQESTAPRKLFDICKCYGTLTNKILTPSGRGGGRQSRDLQIPFFSLQSMPIGEVAACSWGGQYLQSRGPSLSRSAQAALTFTVSLTEVIATWRQIFKTGKQATPCLLHLGFSMSWVWTGKIGVRH